MSLGVVPVMGDFVGEVSGIDLARPLDPRALATIIDAIDRFGVLVFRAQAIDDDALEAFGRQLGPLFNAGTEFGMDFSVIRLGNLDDNNHIHTENDHYRAMNLANAFWHVDNSFSEPPAKYSVLMARIVPRAEAKPNSPTHARLMTRSQGPLRLRLKVSVVLTHLCIPDP